MQTDPGNMIVDPSGKAIGSTTADGGFGYQESAWNEFSPVRPAEELVVF